MALLWLIDVCVTILLTLAKTGKAWYIQSYGPQPLPSHHFGQTWIQELNAWLSLSLLESLPDLGLPQTEKVLIVDVLPGGPAVCRVGFCIQQAVQNAVCTGRQCFHWLLSSALAVMLAAFLPIAEITRLTSSPGRRSSYLTPCFEPLQLRLV